jgi:catechol 2,3-dioxygenase-like lactoylglutathione lyase family enzyme
VPIDHVKLPVTDLGAARTFYAAALAPLGYGLVWDEPPTIAFRPADDEEAFALTRVEGQVARVHVAFTAASAGAVDAFHAAAVSAGGRDNGRPGERPYGRPYYAAFVLDPDGHNVEAVFHGPKRVSRA